MLSRLLRRVSLVLVLNYYLSGRWGLRELAGLAVAVAWLCVDAIKSTGESKPNPASSSRVLEVSTRVMNLACGYDPYDNAALRRFAPIQRHSRCLFAKAATLWGSRDYDAGSSVEANVKASAPMLLQFLLRGEEELLDGFVFEVRLDNKTGEAGEKVAAFGSIVRRVLATLSDIDPSGRRCMDSRWIHDKSWHFQFASIPIFVTTFGGGLYDESSSRHGYGADPRSVFVLLQPEYSFLHHDLPYDTPHTEWEAPRTIRDRIRVSFRDAGQGYVVPPTVRYPPAHHIVKQLRAGDPVVEWWKTGEEAEEGKTHMLVGKVEKTQCPWMNARARRADVVAVAAAAVVSP